MDLIKNNSKDKKMILWASAHIDSGKFGEKIMSQIIKNSLGIYSLRDRYNIPEYQKPEMQDYLNKNDSFHEFVIYTCFQLLVSIRKIAQIDDSYANKDFFSLRDGTQVNDSIKFFQISDTEVGYYFININGLGFLYGEIISTLIGLLDSIYITNNGGEEHIKHRFSIYYSSWGDEALWNHLINLKLITKKSYDKFKISDVHTAYDNPEFKRFLYLIRALDSLSNDIRSDLSDYIIRTLGSPDIKKQKLVIRKATNDIFWRRIGNYLDNIVGTIMIIGIILTVIVFLFLIVLTIYKRFII